MSVTLSSSSIVKIPSQSDIQSLDAEEAAGKTSFRDRLQKLRIGESTEPATLAPLSPTFEPRFAAAARRFDTSRQEKQQTRDEYKREVQYADYHNYGKSYWHQRHVDHDGFVQRYSNQEIENMTTRDDLVRFSHQIRQKEQCLLLAIQQNTARQEELKAKLMMSAHQLDSLARDNPEADSKHLEQKFGTQVVVLTRLQERLPVLEERLREVEPVLVRVSRQVAERLSKPLLDYIVDG